MDSNKDITRTVIAPGEVVRPDVDKEIVTKLVKTLYGLNVTSIKELNSYDDRNFHVTVENTFDNSHLKSLSPDGYVLKILNSLDSNHVDFVDAQNQLILHVYKHGIKTPRPLPNIHGELNSLELLNSNKDRRYSVRLFEYIPGRVLQDVPYTADLVFEIGKIAGQIARAGQDFYHPAHEKHRRIWSLTEVPGLTQFYDANNDPSQKELLDDVISTFNREVVSNYSKLKRGTIHGDFSEQNILIRPSENKNRQFEVAGILDFGDSALTYYVFDIAILICYMMLDSNVLDLFEAGGHTLAGYLSEFSLENQDLIVLKECISARMAQSLILGMYTAKMDPKNSEYILKTSGRGWNFLQKLWSKPKAEMYDIFKECVGRYGIEVNFG